MIRHDVTWREHSEQWNETAFDSREVVVAVVMCFVVWTDEIAWMNCLNCLNERKSVEDNDMERHTADWIASQF